MAYELQLLRDTARGMQMHLQVFVDHSHHHSLHHSQPASLLCKRRFVMNDAITRVSTEPAVCLNVLIARRTLWTPMPGAA